MPPYKLTCSMDKPLPKRKYSRLKDKDIYSHDGTIVHVIIGTSDKKPYFSDSNLAEKFCDILTDVSREKDVKVYAYCIMPDHIHLLLEASKGIGIIEFVKQIKGRFSTLCRKSGKIVHLQRSFYDHILRRDEDVYNVAKYIIGNPVRAGIEKAYGKYPFAGSLVYEL